MMMMMMMMMMLVHKPTQVSRYVTLLPLLHQFETIQPKQEATKTLLTHPSWQITGVLMYSGMYGAAMYESSMYITHAMITTPPISSVLPIVRQERVSEKVLMWQFRNRRNRDVDLSGVFLGGANLAQSHHLGVLLKLMSGFVSFVG